VIGQAFNSPVAVLFSGGLDSSILLGQLLAAGHQVRPLFVACGWHWQPVELRFARRFLQALDEPRLEPLVVLQMPLADLYDDHWSITGQAVPRADEPDQNVYLPGHNPLLLVKAQVWCRLHGVGRLALGALGSNPFSDATEDFFRHFEAAMDRAISGHVELIRPLSHLSKRQVMHLGRELPLEWTFSCLSPVEGRHCGGCNKCAERQQAFLTAGILDPTDYAIAPATVAPNSTSTQRDACFE
jgi:7-cyano-7-deazaguanine synthase